jgi:predicted Zn-dependent protease
VLARLRAALAAGTSTFDAALAEARAAKVPGTSIELFAFDVAFATNRTGEALRALDALSAAGATDPYLDALRGSVLRDLGRAPEARAACRRALEADPHLEEAYWTLLGLAIEGQRHEEALTVLNQMDARFEIDWRGIESSPAYAAFLDSKPGQRWRTKFAGRR